MLEREKKITAECKSVKSVGGVIQQEGKWEIPKGKREISEGRRGNPRCLTLERNDRAGGFGIVAPHPASLSQKASKCYELCSAVCEVCNLRFAFHASELVRGATRVMKCEERVCEAQLVWQSTLVGRWVLHRRQTCGALNDCFEPPGNNPPPPPSIHPVPHLSQPPPFWAHLALTQSIQPRKVSRRSAECLPQRKSVEESVDESPSLFHCIHRNLIGILGEELGRSIVQECTGFTWSEDGKPQGKNYGTTNTAVRHRTEVFPCATTECQHTIISGDSLVCSATTIRGPRWLTTMLLVGEISRGSPVSLALLFRCCSLLTTITLFGSQDLDVKSRPNFFTHSRKLLQNDRGSGGGSDVPMTSVPTLDTAPDSPVQREQGTSPPSLWHCGTCAQSIRRPPLVVWALKGISPYREGSRRRARRCGWRRHGVRGVTVRMLLYIVLMRGIRNHRLETRLNDVLLRRMYPTLTRPSPAVAAVRTFMWNGIDMCTFGKATPSVTDRTRDGEGASMVERLACSPSTKAIRAQSPAGSLRIFACGNRVGRCRWSAVLHHTNLNHPPRLSRPNLFTHSLKTAASKMLAATLSCLALRASFSSGCGRSHRCHDEQDFFPRPSSLAGIREDPGSIPGTAILISAFHGFPLSLQVDAVAWDGSSTKAMADSFRTPS
ncbi:hypothetical protein PR048_019853 [Dryococelus australis]|uniref:Uncharacterized protein n=1 Tax=Dryococelus australis TaxID=614101 RepID=A0ABQ9H4N8_9NEOP|nr:hypothetical protein PR048_019853 [Dryococelus australis]